MPDKNRSHGKINALPHDVKKDVEEKLLNGSTYAEISCGLKEQGYDISPSSAWRYGNSFLKKFESVRIAKEFARLLAEDNIDRPTTELHEANNALISQIIMQALVDEDMELEEKIKAAKQIALLQQAQVGNEKLKIQARKASGEINTALNAFKTKVYEQLGSDYPDIAETVMLIAEKIKRENEGVS
jgi:hypothetical protein